MKRIIPFSTLVSAMVFMAHVAQANGDHNVHGAHDSHGVHGGHGAHVHGVAQLLLSRDGQQLELVLESPAANLVGFEHPPASAEDREAIKQAVASLEDRERLFTLSGGDCTATDVQITNPFEGAGLAENHAEHHHHHHDDETGHSDSHAEFRASYHYTCDASAGLKQLKVGLLTVFPAIEQLDVQWITERGQGAERLGGNNDTVHLQ